MRKQLLKKIALSIIILAIVFTVFACLFGLNNAFSITQTLTSFGIFILALIAFDQFGLKRSRKLKEVELVREFYKELKDVVVYGYTNQTIKSINNVSVTLGQDPVILMIRPYSGLDNFETEELKPKYVVFTTGYHKYFNEKISQLVRNIFFPQEIFELFKFIEHETSQVIPIGKDKWDLEKTVYLSTLTDDFEKVAIIFPSDKPQYRLQPILKYYMKIIEETETFLNENGYTVNKKS